MSSSRERILQMIESRTISAAEGEALLAALDGRAQRRWRLLVDPFERLGVAAGAGIAGVVAVASLGLTRLNVRFDGAIDLHVTGNPVAFVQGLLDQAAAWILTALLLWLAARIAGSRGRVVDFVIGTGVARAPLLLGGLGAGLLLRDAAQLIAQAQGGVLAPALLLSIAVVLPCLVWFVAALLFAFRTASGLKGGRLAVTFILGLLAAEVAAKALVLTIHV